MQTGLNIHERNALKRILTSKHTSHANRAGVWLEMGLASFFSDSLFVYSVTQLTSDGIVNAN